MKKRPFLFAVACLLATVHAQNPEAPPAPVPVPEVAAPAADAPPAAEATRFMRVEKTVDSIQLQTALVHFRKGDKTLDLVGAIHIADGKFYHDLNKRFEGYDALLWEGIGGPKTVATTPPEPATARSEGKTDDSAGSEDSEEAEEPRPVAHDKGGNLGWLHTAYISAAKSLGLTFQLNEVDYQKKNFVHADLSTEEFADAQEKRGESLLGFLVKTGLASAKTKHAQEPNTLKLLISAVRGDKNGIKRELIGTLGSADDQISKLTGETVIVTDRNAKCLQVLDEQVAAGKKKLGIFYGAAHFPDMEKRLLADGWEKTGSEWMVAWDIAN